MYSKTFLVVLDAMKKHRNISQVQGYGCHFLACLAEFEVSQKILVEHHTEEVVLMAVREHRKSPLVQKAGFSTLTFLTKCITEEGK